MLTSEEIDKIAHLARLSLSESEKKKYAEQMSVILDYIKILEEVDTDGVGETCQVTGLEDIFREDVVKECSEETKEKLIAQFPEKIGNQLRVKQVFDN